MATAYPDSEVTSRAIGSIKTTKMKYDVQKIPYFSNTMSLLKSFRLEDSFCDVTIILQDQSFRAHKNILAAGSGYFRAMFTSGYRESSTEEVILVETPDLNAERFALLLDFMYTGELHISLETVSDILAGATYLQINHAVEACADCINQAFEDNRLTLQLVIKILPMTSGHEVNRVKDAANRYLATQFSNICNSESFLKDITFQTMRDLLERNDLVATSEEEVLETVLSWINYDWKLRKICAVDLLGKIRLPIEKRISSFENKLKEIPECKDLFIDILKYHTVEKKLTPRGTFAKDLISISKKSLIFDEKSKKVKSLGYINLPESIPGQSVAVAEGQLYVAGGRTYHSSTYHSYEAFLKAVMMTYSNRQERWISCSPMNTARSHFGFLHIDGYLYAVGGSSSTYTTSEDSFERYHIAGNNWARLPRLPNKLYNMDYPPSVTEFLRCVLVSGNTTRDQFGRDIPTRYHHLVMLYNTTTNVWYTLTSRYLGDYHELHVYVKEESIYLIGFQKMASKHSKSLPNWRNCPTVFRCECDIKSDPSRPRFTIGTRPVSQTCIPETSMRVFRIDSEVYIILRGHVYKTKVSIGGDQVFDADMSSYSGLSHIASNSCLVTSFSVDKKYIH